MSIQGNFNNGLFQLAALKKLSDVNESINELGFNDYKELCDAINKTQIEIAKREDGGEPTENLKELLDQYISLKNAYDESHEKQLKENKKKSMAIVISTLCLCLVTIIISIIIFSSQQKSYNEEHFVGKFECSECGSHDTIFYGHLFYDMHDNIISGSYDYAKEKAYYICVYCNYCHKCFKVYKSQWESL